MKFKEKNIIIFLIIASIAVIFSSFDKYWMPFDEGIVTVAAEQLLHNKIPYKDFFIVNYPPGQIFVLAFLYKIFGVTLEVGRVYTVFIQTAIIFLLFLICKALSRRNDITLLACIVALSSLGPRLGTVPAPIWPGIASGLFSLYLFMRYMGKDELKYIVFSGLAIGITIIFKHEIGIFAWISIFISLFLYKRNFKNLFLFGSVSSMIPLAALAYFISKGALNDLIESLVIFAFVIHEKTASLYFPGPCFNPSMIFHGSLHFIKVNQYYIPMLVYFGTALFLAAKFIKARKLTRTEIVLCAILIFGVLSFKPVIVRTDPPHLLTAIYPAIMLISFLIGKLTVSRALSKRLRYASWGYVLLVVFLFSLLAIKNIDKYFKNVFKKPFIGSTIITQFGKKGSVYVPREEKEDIIKTINFIKANTSPSEFIYLGNMINWKDDFGGSIILYTLCERPPSAKYYETLPGIITQEKVQKEIVSSLQEKKVNFIILQDIGVSSAEETIEKNKLILDDYIKKCFKKSKKFGKYNIYKRI